LVNNETQTNNEDLGILDSFVDKIKQALSSLGLVVENGVAKVREIVAEKIATKQVETTELQMIDKATNDSYCSWIENGEWVKVKGKCDAVEIKNTTKTTTEAKIETTESPIAPAVVEIVNPATINPIAE
ncbi:MAG: hypothetical protein ABIJ83_02000, partial [Patescibacteria group bacterium]|nr:hypothetical protein [Patescibacteria group bacterium]MBU0880425.1 hypothetical protein [Patescibacteria group bacterium]MBU1063033.1 hypothetical protein [Patescibacteria group bacterium]MBU1783045.1 hypothetical protein [Patescibacteria group bacterium]MBU2081174.1 hypothetical protein [Patescibacteria group bacterium]